MTSTSNKLTIHNNLKAFNFMLKPLLLLFAISNIYSYTSLFYKFPYDKITSYSAKSLSLGGSLISLPEAGSLYLNPAIITSFEEISISLTPGLIQIFEERYVPDKEIIYNNQIYHTLNNFTVIIPLKEYRTIKPLLAFGLFPIYDKNYRYKSETYTAGKLSEIYQISSEGSINSFITSLSAKIKEKMSFGVSFGIITGRWEETKKRLDLIFNTSSSTTTLRNFYGFEINPSINIKIEDGDVSVFYKPAFRMEYTTNEDDAIVYSHIHPPKYGFGINKSFGYEKVTSTNFEFIFTEYSNIRLEKYNKVTGEKTTKIIEKYDNSIELHFGIEHEFTLPLPQEPTLPLRYGVYFIQDPLKLNVFFITVGSELKLNKSLIFDFGIEIGHRNHKYTTEKMLKILTTMNYKFK